MKIKILNFRGFNPTCFSNITEGSVHDVLRPADHGWFIRGADGSEVLVFSSEATLLDDEEV